MANKLDPMDLKQIITLHLDGYSNRKIGKTLGISRNTVNQYMSMFKACQMGMQELLGLDDASLSELFTTVTTIDNERYEELMVFLNKMHRERHRTGFTFLLHYQEYRGHSAAPYGYTQFMEHYHRKYPAEKGSMKLEHQAGHEAFVDYAGKKLHIIDRQTGEELSVEVFISVLPFSQYTYVEACESQKKEHFLKCTANALSFFGGVPRAIVCDNLKSAVSRSSKYEPEINRSFKAFARHHNCVINPTRAYSPQDKALVENAVHLVYQRIYHPIRNMHFFSLEALNAEISRLLVRYNDLMFQRKESSRRELFQAFERDALKPLPLSPYQVKGYRRGKVQKIGYIYFSVDRNYYSVPYRFIGRHVHIHFTDSTVEVYFYHERIAVHRRNYRKGAYTTNKDHLRSTHKKYLDWSPEYFVKMASKHGSATSELIKRLFEHNDYPEANYKRAMGIIQLHRAFGSDRLNKACERALMVGEPGYGLVRNILENGLDREPVDIERFEGGQVHIPFHDNIRGDYH